MRRLWKYMEGRKRFAAVMVVVGVGNAACLTGGWLLVRNAIDKGINVHNKQGQLVGDERHLTVIVLIYLGVAAAGRRMTFEMRVGIPCERTSETASTSLVRRAMIQPAFCCEK